MRINTPDGSELITVNALARDGNLLVIKGKIMGSMPMTARLSPAEFRRGFSLLDLKLFLFLLTFPFRGGAR
jgi:hypothetical protein